MKNITLIAAIAHNNVIGYNGDLPWRADSEMQAFCKQDMAHFKALTWPAQSIPGHPVLMGRRTYESIPVKYRPLEGRLNVVLTKDQSFEDEGVVVAGSFEAALQKIFQLERVGMYDFENLCVIGGQQVFATAMPLATRLEITQIHKNYLGDTFFPQVYWNEWKAIHTHAYDTHTFTRYERT